MIISRRALLAGAGAGSLALALPRPAYAVAPRVGAIRWDAWYGATASGTSEYQAVHNLDPAAYQYRAPFFASQSNADLMFINGGQTDVDAEIVYASNAGLKYWAFDWYASGRPLRNAWTYYQASPNKALINWCVLTSYGGITTSLPSTSELVSYFQQATYEKFGSRPMLYLLQDSTTLASVTAQVTALRAACVSAGIGDPYIVVQSGTPSSAASDKTTIGADAIGNYAHAVPGPSTYAAADTLVRAFWATMSATAAKMVPTGMSGWDTRPRIQHPTTIANYGRPFLGMQNYVTPPTTTELATHITALIAYVNANPTPCESNKALIYSWNEMDEGGNGLCPTWTSGGPDNSRLIALTGIL